MWGPDIKIPEHRIAQWIWLCDAGGIENDACPDNCCAQNLLPYEAVEFDPYKFPEEAWVLSPCQKHTDSFVDYPNAV